MYDFDASALGVSGFTTGAKVSEVASQAAAMLMRVAPTVLPTNARGKRFFREWVMTNILSCSRGRA